MRPHKATRAPLRSAVIKSAILHLCVVMLFAISPGFDLSIREKPVDVIWVEIPKGTSDEIRVGPLSKPPPGYKGYPETTIEQQKLAAIPRGEMPMEKESPAPKPTRKPTVQKTVKATGRMTYAKKGAPRRRRGRTKTDRKISNALAMIDKSLADRSAAPGTDTAAPSGTTGGPYYDGYKYGTGTQPLKVSPSDPEYIKYQALVRAKIINHWVIPERFVSAGASGNAKLIVMINMDGEVISTRWSKRSGNSTFDASAKRAVESASPLPKPPQRLAWETYNEGFLIEFDARVR